MSDGSINQRTERGEIQELREDPPATLRRHNGLRY
jgi:hypothetical protein